MPNPSPNPAERPLYYLAEGRPVLASAKSLDPKALAGVTHWCREGDTAWTRMAAGSVPSAPAPAKTRRVETLAGMEVR